MCIPDDTFDFEDNIRAKRCFQEYILKTENKTTTIPKLEIVVTQAMENLYEKIKGNNISLPLLLTGPHGVGKSTTIYWLYRQFHSRTLAFHVDKKSVEEIIEIIPSSTCTIMLCDLNSIQTFTVNVINRLIDLLFMARERGYVCIFASSSAILSTIKSADKTIASRMRSLSDCFMSYRLFPDESASIQLIKYLKPTTSEDKDELASILKTTMGNFMCIVLSCLYQSGSLSFTMEYAINAVWDDLQNTIKSYGSGILPDIRNLYLSLYFQYSIEVYDDYVKYANALLPVLSYVVEIPDTKIPKLLLPIPRRAILSSIVDLSERIVSTDEASAVGFIYEHAVLRYISRTNYVYVDDSLVTTSSVTLPSLTTSPLRAVDSISLAKCDNVIWATPKRTKVVDAFTHVSAEGFHGLFLFSISTIVTNHQNKVQINNIPGWLIDLYKSCESCESCKIYFVYLNPNFTKIDELKDRFYYIFNHYNKLKKENVFLCAPDPNSAETFRSVFLSVRCALSSN